MMPTALCCKKMDEGALLWYIQRVAGSMFKTLLKSIKDTPERVVQAIMLPVGDNE